MRKTTAKGKEFRLSEEQLIRHNVVRDGCRESFNNKGFREFLIVKKGGVGILSWKLFIYFMN